MSALPLYCRFCANEKPQQSLLDIKNTDKLQDSVKQKMLIFKEEIVDFTNEELPKSICTGCFDSLNKSYEFFVQAKESQFALNIFFIDQQNCSELLTLEPLKQENDDLDLNSWTDRDTEPEILDDSWTSYPWNCSHCNINLPTMQDLRLHNQESHETCSQFHCMDCDENTVGFEEFVCHAREHRPSLNNYCQYCNIKCESRAHIDTHKYYCNSCGQPFAQKKQLLTHLQDYKPNMSKSINFKRKYKTIQTKFNFKEISPTIKEDPLENDFKRIINSCSNDKPPPPLYDTILHRLLITHNSEDLKPNLTSTIKNVKKESPTKIELWSEYPHICKYCGLSVANWGILKIHCMSHHKKCFGIKCIDCESDDSNTLDQFAQHVIKHRPNLMSSCHYCYTATTESDYLYHLQTHKSRFQCVACGQHFKNMRDFRCHDNKLDPPLLKPPIKRRKNPITDDEVVCNICNFRAKNPWFLKKHKLIHTDRKRDFTCERCGKAFLSKSTLDSHSKMHELQEDEPKEVCKICGKAFYTVKQLREHVKNHNLVMPYQCDDCKKFFRSKDSLRNHVIVHMDVKPFACQYCQKRFKMKKHMQNHEYQHTGARPFSCDICCLNFTCWSNCDKHLRRIHGMSLAKATVTPYGKMEIDPATGKPKQLSITNDLQEWTKNLIDAKKARKKKTAGQNGEIVSKLNDSIVSGV